MNETLYKGRKYTVLRIIPLDKLYTKPLCNHRRLQVFAQKGLKCVCCDRVGSELLATRHRDGSIHIDLYTREGHLMTVDHIIPKYHGGHKTDIRNMQPMCSACNTTKSSSLPDILTQEIPGGLISRAS